jgi:hypothetical protein
LIHATESDTSFLLHRFRTELMKIRRTPFAAPSAVAILSLLAGCSGQDDPGTTNASDSSVGAMSPDSGGSVVLDAGGGLSGGGDAATTDAAVVADGGSTVPATFETVKFIITQTTCFGAGCHNDDQNPLNLRVDEQLRTRLTTHISKNCGNIPVVNPGKPQESALVKILKGPCGATARMPLGCVSDDDAMCVPADYMAAITQWIALGAPQ